MTLRVCIVLLVFLFIGNRACNAQWPQAVEPDTFQVVQPTVRYSLGTGFGFSSIENTAGRYERFAVASLIPEFSYGKIGVGLMVNLPLKMGRGELRTEDFNDKYDFVGWIRYVQFGQRGDLGFYGRLGELDHVTLGYGQQIRSYRNTISLDDPLRGFEFKHESDQYRIESVCSNLISGEVFGLRGSTHPFLLDTTSHFRRIEIGISLAGDMSRDGRHINTTQPGVPFFFTGMLPDFADSLGVQLGSSDGKLYMVGLDAGLPLREESSGTLMVYGGVSKIVDHGSGFYSGLYGTRIFGERTRVEGRIEQRIIGKEYLPSYFNSLYEAERILNTRMTLEDGRTLTAVNTKRNILSAQQKVLLGSHLSAGFWYRGVFRMLWSYEHEWNRPDGGWLHLDLRLRTNELPYYIRLIYDRINLGSIRDVQSGPVKDSLFRIDLVYRFWDFAMIGFSFRQSYELIGQKGVRVGQKKRSRIEPRILIVLPKQ